MPRVNAVLLFHTKMIVHLLVLLIFHRSVCSSYADSRGYTTLCRIDPSRSEIYTPMHWIELDSAILVQPPQSTRYSLNPRTHDVTPGPYVNLIIPEPSGSITFESQNRGSTVPTTRYRFPSDHSSEFRMAGMLMSIALGCICQPRCLVERAVNVAGIPHFSPLP